MSENKWYRRVPSNGLGRYVPLSNIGRSASGRRRRINFEGFSNSMEYRDAPLHQVFLGNDWGEIVHTRRLAGGCEIEPVAEHAPAARAFSIRMPLAE